MIKNLNELFAPIKIEEIDYVSGGFFPHVKIRNGVVFFDDNAEKQCLLHEIGHLALFPSDLRNRIKIDIDFTAENEDDDQSEKIYFTENEDHLIVWQKCVTEQLKLPENYKYLEEDDEECYQIIDKESVLDLFNKLEMGFDPISETFKNVVSPL